MIKRRANKMPVAPFTSFLACVPVCDFQASFPSSVSSPCVPVQSSFPPPLPPYHVFLFDMLTLLSLLLLLFSMRFCLLELEHTEKIILRYPGSLENIWKIGCHIVVLFIFPYELYLKAVYLIRLTKNRMDLFMPLLIRGESRETWTGTGTILFESINFQPSPARGQDWKKMYLIAMPGKLFARSSKSHRKMVVFRKKTCTAWRFFFKKHKIEIFVVKHSAFWKVASRSQEQKNLSQNSPEVEWFVYAFEQKQKQFTRTYIGIFPKHPDKSRF